MAASSTSVRTRREGATNAYRNSCSLRCLALSSPAFAGFGSSAVAIKAAVQSGSVDAIVAELEKAEELPSHGAIDVVLPLVDHDSWRVRDAAGWWLTRRGVRTQVIASMTARLHGLGSGRGAQRRRRARRHARLLDGAGARRPTWPSRSTRTRASPWPRRSAPSAIRRRLTALQRRARLVAGRRARAGGGFAARSARAEGQPRSPRRRRRCCRCSVTPTPTCAVRRS